MPRPFDPEKESGEWLYEIVSLQGRYWNKMHRELRDRAFIIFGDDWRSHVPRQFAFEPKKEHE